MVAGAAAPVVFAACTIFLTIHERSWLRASGWSPVSRSEVAWPSILSLGPGGWLMTAAFIASGALGLAFAAALFVTGPETRVVAVLVAVIAAATGLEALAPDAPGRLGAASWHDSIHNGVYPLIPAASIVAATAVARTRWACRGLARASLTAATMMALASLATFADAAAQLARFVLFAAIVGWLEVLAWSQLRRSRG